MATKTVSFRIGRVRAYRRGRVWYLAYHEHGQRRQPRVGPDRAAAKQLAAEINSQLEVGAPSALGFQPVSIVDLRQRWLDHHEHVRRSSLATINRYRSATAHLVDFLGGSSSTQRAADFRGQGAEDFVAYLRSKKIAPNGHRNARKRPLRDAGIKFILETCCSLFNYAARHRHLPPYAENPFLTIEIGRIPVEDARPAIALTQEQQVRLLRSCDDWQFATFLMLLFTGLRPGELVHLLLPDELDLKSGWLRIRNKPELGWKVKTRNERDIPLVPALVRLLRRHLKGRTTGPIFLQRRCTGDYHPSLLEFTSKDLQRELARRVTREEAALGESCPRSRRQAIARTIWRDLGALKEDWLRKEFMTITASMGMPELTAPKTLRHTFATLLQDANVDPLVRNELMGHAPMAARSSGAQLGMTAVYTHTRPETKRKQLEAAVVGTLAESYAQQRMDGL